MSTYRISFKDEDDYEAQGTEMIVEDGAVQIHNEDELVLVAPLAAINFVAREDPEEGEDAADAE